MKIETDQTKTRGICELFPKTKKERKVVLKLHTMIMDNNPSTLTFNAKTKLKSLIIYRKS